MVISGVFSDIYADAMQIRSIWIMLFKNLNAAPPFQLFESYYVKAEENGRPHVEAGCVSSVEAGYVNFKYFFEDHLIFR